MELHLAGRTAASCDCSTNSHPPPVSDFPAVDDTTTTAMSTPVPSRASAVDARGGLATPASTAVTWPPDPRATAFTHVPAAAAQG